MTIPCKTEDGKKCPYIKFCLARLADPTIVGCGLPLYWNGLISKGDVQVIHRVKKDASPKDIPKKRKERIKK